MSETNKEASCQANPCGSWGTDQSLAVVWFVAIIVIGVGLTIALRNTDLYNYNTNGEFFDYDAYKENRRAQTLIASDNIDKRSQGDLVTTKNNLK